MYKMLLNSWIEALSLVNLKQEDAMQAMQLVIMSVVGFVGGAEWAVVVILATRYLEGIKTWCTVNIQLARFNNELFNSLATKAMKEITKEKCEFQGESEKRQQRLAKDRYSS